VKAGFFLVTLQNGLRQFPFRCTSWKQPQPKKKATVHEKPLQEEFFVCERSISPVKNGKVISPTGTVKGTPLTVLFSGRALALIRCGSIL